MLKLTTRMTTKLTIMKLLTTKALFKSLKSKRKKKITCVRLLLLKLSNNKKQLNNVKNKLKLNEHLNLPKNLLKLSYARLKLLSLKELH